MKRHSIFKLCAVSITATMLIGIMQTGCTPKEQETTKSAESAFTTSSIALEGETPIGCKLYTDYPVKGSDALVQNVREWMNETLGGDFEGDLNDGKKMVEFYYNKINNELKASDESLPEDISAGGSLRYIQMRKIFETELFITYSNDVYQYYAGAAHGGQLYSGIVFRKSDGRRFGWEMFKQDSLETVRNLIITGLQQQFFKVNNKDELYDQLLIENNGEAFPLPETNPLWTGNGVKFIYQQYEIAAYAYGHPSCTIPYEVLENCFTTSARSLAKSYNDKIATSFKQETLNLGY